MWVLFAFLSAFCESAKDVLGKSGSTKTNVLITAFSVQFFGLILLVPMVFLTGIPELKPGYWTALLAAIFTIPTANILYMRAIKLSPLSISVPILSFNPIFTALLSFVFDKKLPDLLGWIGIIFVCSGLYLSRLDKESIKRGFLHPLLSVKEDAGSMSMLGVAVIWSIGAHISKMVVVGSSPLFGAMSFGILGSILLALIGMATRRFHIQMIKSHIKQLGLLGIFNGFSELAMNSALAIGFTPYIISIKRTNIIWSSLLGKFLHGDRFNKFKTFGLLLMFSGILLIII